MYVVRDRGDAHDHARAYSPAICVRLAPSNRQITLRMLIVRTAKLMEHGLLIEHAPVA